MKKMILMTLLLNLTTLSFAIANYEYSYQAPDVEQKLNDAECIVKKSRYKCDANSTYSGYNAWCKQNVRLRFYDGSESSVKVVGNGNSSRDEIASFMTFGLLDIGGKTAVTNKAKNSIKDKLYLLDSCR